MSEITESSSIPAFTSERRLHPRHRIQSLAYVDLGEDNGGIVLNISEAGLALQAAITLVEEDLPHIQFQLPPSKQKLEAKGRITWLSSTGKEAGVAFVNLAEDVRAQITKWILLDSNPGVGVEIGTPPTEERFVENTGQATAIAVETLSAPEAAAPRIPETVVHEPAASAPPKPERERPRAGPATFGSLGHRKDAAPTGKISFAAMDAPAKIPVQSGQLPAPGASAALFTAEADTNRRARTGRESAFALREPLPQIHAGKRGKRRWLAFGGAVVSLAAISFAVGMLAGRGDFGAVADIFSKDNAAARPSVGAAVSSAPNPEAPERSAPAEKNSGGSANNTVAAPETQRPPAQVLTLRRSRPESSGAETGRAESPAILALPESPVSASPSVAVRTRRSIPLPSDTRASTLPAGQSLQIGALLSKTDPAYPQEARDQKIEGTVRLHASIGEDGRVRQVDVLGGPPALATAASTAIQNWRYAPTVYEGQPIETEEDVIVVFRLPH